ncbi:MAG: hypothetical protein JNG89_10920 [Planctomycetaceae bacterium]|nr:hypothetical protein [Planctomycetaceae bacterium]
MTGSRAISRWGRVLAATAACVVCLCVAVAPATAQDDDAMSVEEFVQKRDRWQILQGATLKVEGRYRGLNDDRLSFTNCDLLFQFADGVKPPPARDKIVQVSGSIETRQGKLTFLVTRIKALPSDAETLADRRGRLTPDNADPWYTLADWASSRGAFYEDADLQSSAAELRRTAIDIEYRQIKVTDIEPLYALARKAQSLGLPPEMRDDLYHDALRRELRASRQRDPRQRDVVLTHILDRLPGSGVPIDEETFLREQPAYEQDPLEVYRGADADKRRILARILYSSACLERIELDADPEGRNGFAIAGRIEQSASEYQSRADEYRQKEIDWQQSHLAELSRDELLQLVERLESRNADGDSARVVEAKSNWLAGQESRFRERGASGLLDFAQEHVALLDDADRAAVLYMELFNDPAAQSTARARLVELGYQFDGTTWTKDLDDSPDPTVEAIRRGIVRKGMTSDQVRAAFGGPPASVVRFAVLGQVCELWVYREHGVAIEFSRRGPEAAMLAVSVSELGP